MENYIQQIVDRGYAIVEKTAQGVCFVNENTRFGVILVANYRSDGPDIERGHGLHEILKDKYGFTEKATICVIVDTDCDKEALKKNEYYFVKIFADRINILPTKSDKSITVTFDPMVDINDHGNYYFNPFETVDGLVASNFIEYLSNAKSGDVVKYPKAVEIRYFIYLAQKLYNTLTNR